MIEERSHYCMLQVTLEATSAHGVHSGRGDATHDVLVVRDANGLPALPGSSIAGILRHAFMERHGEKDTNSLFGYIGKDQQPSWLTVAWGLVHDSHDQPCEGIDPKAGDDELLHDLLDSKPLVRQRVRLTHRGTAASTGKFDTTLIPAGVRYTTVIGYWCDGSETSRQQWASLLALLQQPALYIGHGTRSGAGAFRVHALHQGCWDLRTAEGQAGYCSRPRSRCVTTGLTPVVTESNSSALFVTLELQAESGWRIGGGERPLGMMLPGNTDKIPDLLPMHEARVTWAKGKGVWQGQYHLLPGSAIKGALRHRLAYHYRCLSQQFAEDGVETDAESCPAVKTLFGFATDQDAGAGLLVVPDIALLEQQTRIMMHNRIDRFTGGVMRGALFGEQVLWRSRMTLRLEVLSPTRMALVEPAMRQALQRTLEDLAQGWLPLGAGGSRGLGVFTDTTGAGPQWSDNGTWVNAADVEEATA